MKRWLTTLLMLAVCSAAVHADLTIVQTTTIEGGMAAMGGAAMSPTLTNRIKGSKARSDIDSGMVHVSTIADVGTNQVVVLRHDQKTAQVVSVASGAAPSGAPAGVTGPSVDGSLTPTGRTQRLDGYTCDEFAFTVTADMSEMHGPQMPPEMASALKDLKMVMKGSMWVAKDAPGASEYAAFQKAIGADMSATLASATGVKMPGMERLGKVMAGIGGMAYLTEMTITVDGTGQMADMMQQMGPVKVTTKVNSISTDSLADDVFKVPDGYQVVK